MTLRMPSAVRQHRGSGFSRFLLDFSTHRFHPDISGEYPYNPMVKFAPKPQQEHPESIFSGFTSVNSETIKYAYSIK